MRYSQQRSFNTCPFLYKLQTEDKLQKQQEGKESNDKIWGQAFHKAMEVHYLGGTITEAQEAFRKVYPRDLNPEERIKTLANGLAIVKGYIEFYKEQDKNWKTIATEVEGNIVITGEAGEEDHELHIDLVAENLQGGGIYFWDHKTTYKLPYPSYWKPFELSAQLTRYTAYVKEKFGQCSGAYINNVTVGYTAPYEKGKTNNTYFESLKNPMSFYEHREKKYSKYHKKDMTVVHGATAKFERQLFNRSDEMIEFWRQSDQDWIKTIEFCKKNNVWPKHLGTLCGWCEMFDLCQSSNNPQIRELLYETKMGDLKVG